ncbi:MAG: 3-deoxy-manno-octulosonate cytidylyltransferase [Myxococcaceae bacterium]
MSSLRPIAVIPSRYASTRFPGKPLASIAGKLMVQHVYDRCLESKAFARVLVATDDERVAAAVRGFGGEAILTSAGCLTGTDRVAEVARSLPGSGEVFVNVQGDEPAIHPSALETLALAFDDPRVLMATLVRPLAEAERQNPNVVKALVGQDGFALYFSRADLPYLRNEGAPLQRFGHLGIYGYRRQTLERLSKLPPSPLEQAESLEQLRALENGIRIACRPTAHRSVGVDRPEDVPAAAALLRELALA